MSEIRKFSLICKVNFFDTFQLSSTVLVDTKVDRRGGSSQTTLPFQV